MNKKYIKNKYLLFGLLCPVKPIIFMFFLIGWNIYTNTSAIPQPIHNVIIIGSGPAGLTAGIYAARAQLNPLIIEGKTPSQLINATSIENWPGIEKISGFELVSNLREHAQKLGTKFLPESIIKVDFSQKPLKLW